jgi:hypothetical protein
MLPRHSSVVFCDEEYEPTIAGAARRSLSGFRFAVPASGRRLLDSWSSGSSNRMKALHKLISPIFSVGLVIFVSSYLIVYLTDGGGGPCNLPDVSWLLSLLGVLLGTIGMVVGLPISAIKTGRHFRPPSSSNQTSESNPSRQ